MLCAEAATEICATLSGQVGGQQRPVQAVLDKLAAVRTDPPDVVVTDIRMPPTNTTEGLMAALAIRSELPDVAVLVLSQYVETHHAMDPQ